MPQLLELKLFICGQPHVAESAWLALGRLLLELQLQITDLCATMSLCNLEFVGALLTGCPRTTFEIDAPL